MKTSELKQLIREIILENYGEVNKKLNQRFGLGTISGKGNIMRPKSIDIWFTDRGNFYKALVDKNRKSLPEIEEMLKSLTKLDIDLGYMREDELNKIKRVIFYNKI